MKSKCTIILSNRASLIAWLVIYVAILGLIVYISIKYNVIEFFVQPAAVAMPYSAVDSETLFQPMPFTEPWNDYKKNYKTLESYSNPVLEEVSQTALRIAPYLNN
jgi:hypothetical protein